MSRQKHKKAAARHSSAAHDSSSGKRLPAVAPAAASVTASVADDGSPFGTRPRRRKGPLIAWCIAYAVWLGVLLYFAAYTVGLK